MHSSGYGNFEMRAKFAMKAGRTVMLSRILSFTDPEHDSAKTSSAIDSKDPNS